MTRSMTASVQQRRAAAGVGQRRYNRLVGGLLTAAMLLMALYVRNENAGGGALQFTLTGALLPILGYLMLTTRRRTLVHRFDTGTLYILCGALAALSLVSAIVNQVEFGNFVRTQLRIWPFLLLIVATLEVVKRGVPVRYLITPVIATTLVATVWTLADALVIQGISLDQGRYRLLAFSTLVVAAFAIPFMSITTRGLMAIGFLLLVVILVYLTQTRSFLLTIGIVLLLNAIFVIKSGEAKRTMLMVITLAAATAVAAVALGTGAFDAWISRLNAGSGYRADPTWLTRLAEYRGQMEVLQGSPLRLLIGAGPGSFYRWDDSVIREILVTGVVFRAETLHDRFDFGHSLYVYSFYSLGLVGAWILPAIVSGAAVKSLAAAARLSAAEAALRDLYLGFASAMLVTLITGLTAFPISDRHGSLVIGLFCALGYVPVSVMRSLLQSRLRGTGRRSATAARHVLLPARAAAGQGR